MADFISEAFTGKPQQTNSPTSTNSIPSFCAIFLAESSYCLERAGIVHPRKRAYFIEHLMIQGKESSPLHRSWAVTADRSCSFFCCQIRQLHKCGPDP